MLEMLTEKMNYSFQQKWIHLSDLEQILILEKCLLNFEDYSSASLHRVIRLLLHSKLMGLDPISFWKQASPLLAKHLIDLLHEPSYHSVLNTVPSPWNQINLAGAFEAIGFMLQEFTKCSVTSTDFVALQYSPKNACNTYFTMFADSLCGLLREEMKLVHNELRENDITSHCLHRIQLCASIWGFILQCYQQFIHDPSSSISCSLRENCNMFVQLLKRSDIHANNVGSLWASLAVLLLFTCNSIPDVESILQPLLNFFQLLFDRIVRSPFLLLFEVPSINDGFRYSITTSIQNSDSILKVLLTPEYMSLLKKEILSDWIQMIQNRLQRWIQAMPFRKDMLLSIASFATSLYINPQWKVDGQKILEILLENADSEGIIIGWFSKASCLEDWLLSCTHTVMDMTILHKELQESRQYSIVDPFCKIICRVYFRVNKKMEMQCLLYLENIAVYSNYYLSHLALGALQSIISDFTSHSLVKSFTISFLKKEWKRGTPSSLLRLSFIIVQSIPSFAPYAMACRLQGGDGTLEVPLMMNGAIQLGSVLL